MRLGLIFIWLLARAMGADYDPNEVIARAKAKVLENVRSVPNYTCVETVSREYFEPLGATLPRACEILLEQRQHPTLDMGLHLYSRDRLRLDVTMASRGEVFSWAGASHFDDGGIDHVIRSGPMSSGSFAGYLTAVFKTDAKKLTYEGIQAEGNRFLMQYSFRIPLADSHYRVKVRSSWEAIEYSGSVDVDPETADVVRMRITTGVMPAASGLCQASSKMDFTRVQIGETQVLLPSNSRSRYAYPTAEEVETNTVFANWREYRGESTLRFGPYDGSTDTVTKSNTPLSIFVPVGVPFTMALTSAIAIDTAAAGDPFNARLADSIKDFRGRIVAPKGTPVEGHIVRVQSYTHPVESLVVLRPEALRIHGQRVTFNALRDWGRAMLENKRKGKKGIEIRVPEKGEWSTSSFRFSGEHVIVPVGYVSEWRTTYHTAN